VGFNATVTVAPGKASAPIYWYAGSIEFDSNGGIKTTPVELGAINLNPSDPLLQHTQGLVGALVIEPEGSRWKEDTDMRAAATVTKADGSTFRDFVLISQDDLNLPFGNNSTSHAVNYRTEPMAYRFPTPILPGTDVKAATANALVGGVDPQTPIYKAAAGSEVRFRMLHPASSNGADGETLTIDGHLFQEEPYTNDSRTIGFNPLSQWFGTRGGHGARDRFEVVLTSAGGEHKVPGDYLYRSLISLGGSDFVAGKWGIFRVEGPTPPYAAALATAAEIVEAPVATSAEAPAESPIAKRFKNRGKTLKERIAEAPEKKD
jgi:manganese oxidase